VVVTAMQTKTMQQEMEVVLEVIMVVVVIVVAAMVMPTKKKASAALAHMPLWMESAPPSTKRALKKYVLCQKLVL
jgi:hypothetical protein